MSRESSQSTSNSHRYFTVWRWHFYAGMFVAPFLIILSVTALGMLFMSNTVGRDGDRLTITTPESTLTAPVSTQAKNALSTLPDSTLVKYVAPRDADTVALFQIKSADHTNTVAVNPYTADVVNSTPASSALYDTFNNIHGDLLIGKAGDYLLETAASLTILMILSGWYLWWQKRKSLKAMLIPNEAVTNKKKRPFIRTIHATLGSWVSILLLFFCISGMAWAGVWGERLVQAWGQFPAGKWGVAPVPMSIDHSQHSTTTNTSAPELHVHGAAAPTHGSVLNSSKTKEVPWVLELTPMPASGTTMGENGIASNIPIMIDTVDRYAREIGFVGRYQLNLPQGETGVWTLSQDSMSYDMTSPTADRTVHIDRYSGNVLADIHYDDYNVFGKFMAAGIALHMGTLGWWSVLANVLFCLFVIIISVSGYVMWWQRRPRNTNEGRGLNPPARGQQFSVWWPLALPLLIIAIMFPTAIIAISIIALLDFLVISRMAFLQKLLK
ncbi:PepSY-associated TM helix domain-containing protein [Psychrobacter sp.]|uniref:PepSY-associated TM helix domain-containing protein n=1 Tax=Psychrobacter sp. TaxID=56811 RepID=UPI002649FE60|nr:PepSY domain-containing protein [Psychrobacter sp.]MDN6276201.1 PepSY domain-containing protein [Psychrobacter sp.]MDN6308881.1 PepSY domain-containing protein [Psychrobacter sp.]